MARIFTEGFELGRPQFDFYFNTQMVTAVVRSGVFSLGGESNGYGEISINNETELYVRFALSIPSPLGSPGYQSIFHFLDAAGSVIALQFNQNWPIRVLFRGSPLTEDAYITPRQLKINEWHLVEARYQFVDHMDETYDLLVQVKIEGVMEVNKTIQINSGPPIELTKLRWAVSSWRARFDDLAVNTADGGNDGSWPGDGKIIAVRPNGNGDSSDFLGSDGNSIDNYLLVAEATPDNNTTYVESEDSGDEDLYAVQDITLQTGDAIKRVWAAANARETSADGDTLQLGLKPAGASSASWTTTPPLTENFEQYKSVAHTVNPHTSSAWTQTDINDLQVGIKVP